jgi:Cu(I)/Ag(I) efflux system membrane fusion protein
MKRRLALILVAISAAIAGAAGGYLLADPSLLSSLYGMAGVSREEVAASAPTPTRSSREVLYYKDPKGRPEYSAVPKKDATGTDFLPVYADEEPQLAAPPSPARETASPAAATSPASRRVLYYRHPMGLRDTSPVPKKDAMGMDYIPVYADEVSDEGVVRVSPERVQMLGVRTAEPTRRRLTRGVRALGTVQYDERRVVVVSTKFEGWIERLIVNATGAGVRRGEPLMQVYSPDLLLAQQEYAALRDALAATGASGGGEEDVSRRLLQGAQQRLTYLDLPAAERRALEAGAAPARTITLRSPVAGTVIEKPAVEGMRFMPGEPLYRLVDLSQVWVIADVFEQDLARVAVGQTATVTVKSYPDRTFPGRVTFIYPAVAGETRTARVRIELVNPGGALKAEMAASVDIAGAADGREVIAIPDSAVIDTGAQQMVLVALGDGRFAPRPVRLGERADGYTEVRTGLSLGERVVTSANFLIDAESNLRGALQAFTAPEREQ